MTTQFGSSVKTTTTHYTLEFEMPFVTETIVNTDFVTDSNTSSDPTSALFIFFALIVAYIFRVVIFVGIIFIVKLMLLCVFGYAAYRYFIL